MATPVSIELTSHGVANSYFDNLAGSASELQKSQAADPEVGNTGLKLPQRDVLDDI